MERLGSMSSAKSNKNHLFGHAIAEDLVRRYFSRSLDKKDKVGLPAFGMQALCLPPERRVFKLCCELFAIFANFSAYLLRFDATSTFGIMGAFFANVSLMCNLTGILNCLFMGLKLSAGKGSVYEVVDVLQGVGQTFMMVIFIGWLTCSTPSTSRPMTTCVGQPCARCSVTRIFLLYGTSLFSMFQTHPHSWAQRERRANVMAIFLVSVESADDVFPQAGEW